MLGNAPFGYRYVPADAAGAAAQYNPHLGEALVVREIFHWIGVERITLRQACKRLEKRGILSPSGMSRWCASSLHHMLTNPAYKGSAAYGKTCRGPMRPRLRPVRNSTGTPRGGRGIYRAESGQWISIPVPALIDAQLFDAAAEQLEENRKRRRQRKHGVRHLLQGLLVCKCCGYACYGTCSGSSAGKRSLCYYRCPETEPYRCGGRPVCQNKSVRQEVLDKAVWNDLCVLLADPARVEHELQRRLEGGQADEQRQAGKNLEAQIARTNRGINRLIDAYEQELLTKGELEPRIASARRQLSQLREQLQQQVDQAAQAREMKLVIDNLEAFSKQIASGLKEADWKTRREIICTLVKRVEIDPREVTIVYRVDVRPFEPGPNRGHLQHCTRRDVARCCPDFSWKQ